VDKKETGGNGGRGASRLTDRITSCACNPFSSGGISNVQYPISKWGGGASAFLCGLCERDWDFSHRGHGDSRRGRSQKIHCLASLARGLGGSMSLDIQRQWNEDAWGASRLTDRITSCACNPFSSGGISNVQYPISKWGGGASAFLCGLCERDWDFSHRGHGDSRRGRSQKIHCLASLARGLGGSMSLDIQRQWNEDAWGASRLTDRITSCACNPFSSGGISNVQYPISKWGGGASAFLCGLCERDWGLHVLGYSPSMKRGCVLGQKCAKNSVFSLPEGGCISDCSPFVCGFVAPAAGSIGA